MATVNSLHGRRSTPDAPVALRRPTSWLSLTPIPDLASWRQLAVATLAVWVMAALTAILGGADRLGRTMGDTDDALRMTMVRDLASGRGWFDQKLTRLQPPEGLYMHWSRLVDGAEAGLLTLFRHVLPASQAEMAMRLTWPLLWIPPVTVAVLLIARRLGGGRAVFLGAVAVIMAFTASGDFRPGRVDHHNVQIACCLMALAAATQGPSIAWAVACALASAMGLAVGLEALPFIAVIGVAMGGAWAFGQGSGRALAAYGLALAAAVLALYGLETPPDRWLLPACDALASNLVCGLVVAGVGLTAVSALGARAERWPRLGLLAGVGGLSGAAYLALEPLCLRGPMAAVDPEVRANWMTHVREVAPWLDTLGHDPGIAISIGAPAVIGLVGWLWLGRRPQTRNRAAWVLVGAVLLVSIIMGLGAVRFAQYAMWFAAPLAAAAVVDFAEVALSGRMIPAIAALAVATLAPGYAVAWAVDTVGDEAIKASSARVERSTDLCTETAALQPLARLPTGLVLSEIDAGPYILAATAHSVVQAPYHRMTWGIKAAWAALEAPPAVAESRVRALNAAYVVDCPSHASNFNHRHMPAGSLQKALDQGRSPAWLEPLSRPGDPLQIYRVR